MMNSRYEYSIREYPTIVGQLAPPDEEVLLEKDGWRRAWADITMEGTFVVFRREIELHRRDQLKKMLDEAAKFSDSMSSFEYDKWAKCTVEICKAIDALDR